ncbi:MAG: hypothetical protein ABJG68_07100 [Crocinitomicaceae bacterium]
MKKLLSIIALLALNAIAFGQAPEKFSYQAVVRDATGASVVSTFVGVKVSILQTSSLGTEVFSETHTPTTNSYGLINLQIGTGTNTGPALSTIDWGADNYFIKIEIDPAGGTSYVVSSVSQLLSVPYALYAKNVENADDDDADSLNEVNTALFADADSLKITDAGGTLNVDMTPFMQDPDMDPSNEFQTLSKVGQVVTLSDGGGAFTDDVDDADNDPSNEFQTITQAGSTVTLSDGGGSINIDDADANSTNEIQTFSQAGNIYTLSNGGGSVNVDDGDANSTNELQTISQAGSVYTLSNGGGNINIDDADADASNEIQTFSQAGSVYTLSNGGGSVNIDDADADATNESLTNAVLNGTDLEITESGNLTVVDLSTLGGGGDPSTTNELITTAVLNGTDLEITEAGTLHTVDLSSLGGGVDPSATNELITGATLNGTDLEITDAGGTTTVDLSTLGGAQFHVGMHYQGGIIVYVDTTGEHGLIAGTVDLGTTSELFESPNTAPLVATDSTDGAANTALLVAAAGTYPPADLCDAYTGGGFTDWYLPAVYELQLIANSNYIMGGSRLALGVLYWSSTETNSAGNGLSAYTVNNNPNFIEAKSQSTTNIRVRPMRAF